jgi:hypothetical protein
MNFLQLFEPLPLQHLFFATLIWVALTGAMVMFIVRLAVRLTGIDPNRPIEISNGVISSVSAMFALMVAFSASGIWNDAIQARAAVQREANAIENVNALAAHYPAELREDVHDALLLYGRRVIDSDWPAMQRRADVNETLFQRGNGPLVQLIDQIAEAASRTPDLPYSNLLISQLLDLRSARLQREVIARGGVTTAQWIGLVTIAIAAMFMIAVAHNQGFGLQLTAMSAYVFGVSAALFVVLAHDRPFVGHSGVRPLPIQQAIDRIEHPPHP